MTDCDAMYLIYSYLARSNGALFCYGFLTKKGHLGSSGVIWPSQISRADPIDHRPIGGVLAAARVLRRAGLHWLWSDQHMGSGRDERQPPRMFRRFPINSPGGGAPTGTCGKGVFLEAKAFSRRNQQEGKGENRLGMP